MSNYKYTGSFKFWCQTVLPTVYDDSLSYYELLCKVVNYLNDVIENLDGLHEDVVKLSKLYNELKKYVDDYFKNLDVQSEINNKLDEMATDGTLQRIFGESFLGLSFHPSKSKKERYQEYLRSALVSYLVRQHGSSSIESGTVIDNITFKYDNLKDYAGLFGIGSFTKDKVEDDLHVFYLDCTTFASLILRGRRYENSVYPQIIAGITDDETLLNYATEISDYNADYTLDWLNNLQTGRDAYIMENSGNNLHIIFEINNGVESSDQVSIDSLETGDMIYQGRSGRADQGKYLGIYHLGFYVKSLDELNKYAANYGIVLKAMTSDNSDDLGYVVDMYTDSLGGLRIVKLRDYFKDPGQGDAWFRVYKSKVNSNALNSNKALRELIGKDNLYKTQSIYNPASAYDGKITANLNTGTINLNSASQIGKQIPSGSDMHNIDVGTWRCTSASNLETITNIPYNSEFFTVEKIGYYADNKFYGNMLFKTISANYPDIYLATCSGDIWSDWKPISTPVSGLTNISTTASSIKQVEVTFDKPLAHVPNVSAMLRTSTTAINLGNVSLGVNNITRNGFTLTLYNAMASSLNINVIWTAF